MLKCLKLGIKYIPVLFDVFGRKIKMEKMFLQVEALQADLECMRKENETLRFMLGAMNGKCNILQSHLQGMKVEETGINLMQSEAKKRARSDEVPTQSKTSQIFVRTDSNDNSLVSLYIYIYVCVCVCNG